MNKPDDLTCPTCGETKDITLISTDKANTESMLAIHEMEDKYSDLVWYARKPDYKNMKEYYHDTPEEILDRAVLHMRKIEDKYPKESRKLSSDESNFSHGFNSGCLAAFRYVITALDHKKVYCEEMEEYVPRGGVDMANEMFPWLDT